VLGGFAPARRGQNDPVLRRALPVSLSLLALAGAGCGLGEEPETTGPAAAEPATARAVAAPSPTTRAAAPTPAGPRLTVAQLVGQRLVASFRGTATPPPALVSRIRRGELAGVVLFAENASTRAQARRLTRRLQAIPRPAAVRAAPLLIMVDQEGGLVKRITDAPPRRGALAAARAGDAAAIEAEGRRTGQALRRAGINVDLAPVADVPRSGSALLREQRTYGATAAQVRRFAPRFARGLVRGGVQATAKHFPGFGAATVNTDDAPATIRLSRAQLRAVDERAARAVVAAGAGLVMLSNAIYPALDARRPATLSRTIASTELRERAGFTGVSITDDLEANALRRYGDAGAVAVASARAGTDLLLLGRSLAATARAARSLEAAARDGRLPRAGLEASAARVLALRRATTR
jgi:beta-N-acetylhexosaminidase